jgi:succinyl-CoA synthetase beta subunit
MHLHEYQAKMVLRKYGISVPDFEVVSNVEEAKTALNKTKCDQAVVKVQIHAGGRGKAGGVKIAKNRQEILKSVESLIGLKILNNQTGSEGIVAKQVLISPLVDYKKEYYLGAVIDRQNAQAMLIASPEGGMEIEEIAKKSPERIKMISIPNNGKLRGYQLIEIAKFMGWEGHTADQGKKMIAALAKAFVETDAMLIEINPLVQTNTGDIVALDAKITIDDNALYRHPEFKEFYDASQVTSNEALANEYDLAYVALDGTIGCMVNGAGLAMATMDIIKHYGGSPANFLDVGGSATEEKIAEGFKIILSDSKIDAILVNIFGGIMNCATIASGLVAATSKQAIKVPVVIRMEGTNVEKGKKILEESGLNIIFASNLEEAAQKVVAAAKEKG